MYDVKQFDPKAVNQKGPEATFLAALHAMKDAGRKLPITSVPRMVSNRPSS